MTRWTLDHGQLQRDGEPIIVLTRAVWGDGAPPAAEIAALERRIVALLNADESAHRGECADPDCRGVHDFAHGIRYGVSRLTGRPLAGHPIAPHPFRHPSTSLNGACLDCGEHEEDGPHTAA